MIEKKIKYDINIEKPSKTKPVTQGGVLNYLGKQKTVTAPRRWRSSPKHPIAHLAYITKDEEKILVDLDLYNSLKGRPNKGPSGIMSLNGGGGGGDGGSSGGDGDSGPGGSDDGSGHGGPGPGSTGGPGAEGGFGIGPDAESEAAASNAAAAAAAASGFSPDIGGIVGPGPGQVDTTGFGTDYSDVDMGPVGLSAQGLDSLVSPEDYNLVDEATAKAGLKSVVDNMKADMTKDMSPLQEAAFNLSINNPFTSNFQKASNFAFSPIGTTLASFSYNPDLAGNRGYTDYGNTPSSTSPGDGGGGITTIPTYAPLTNVSTGDNTADAFRTRLENLLKPSGGTGYQSNSTYQNFLQSPFYDPKVAGAQVITPVTLPSGQILNLPNAATANQFNQYLSSLLSLPNQSVNSLSGYTLADLIRLRGR